MHLGEKGKKDKPKSGLTFTTVKFKGWPPRCKASVHHSGLSAQWCMIAQFCPIATGARSERPHHCLVICCPQTSILGL